MLNSILFLYTNRKKTKDRFTHQSSHLQTPAPSLLETSYADWFHQNLRRPFWELQIHCLVQSTKRKHCYILLQLYSNCETLNISFDMHLLKHTNLVIYEVTVFVTVDSLITLEDTVAGTSTHEVVVTLTWGKTAAHSCPRLATAFTALVKKKKNAFNKCKNKVKNSNKAIK